MTKARDLANFSASTGVVDADIGSTVQAYDSNLTSFVGAFTLPTSDGSNGQALITNGSGTVAFGSVDSLPSQSGNSGKFLTTDGSTASWAATGGAWDLLATVNASSAATVEFDGYFTSGYAAFALLTYDAKMSHDNKALYWQVKTTAYLTNNEYTWTGLSAANDASIGNANSTSNPFGSPTSTDSIGNASQECWNLEMFLYNFQSTTNNKKVFSRCGFDYTDNALKMNHLITRIQTASAITAIKLYPSSESINGNFYLYGIKNA